eukprot:786945-Pleurochrysis_carterae.AAC.1
MLSASCKAWAREALPARQLASGLGGDGGGGFQRGGRARLRVLPDNLVERVERHVADVVVAVDQEAACTRGRAARSEA